jgi:hypothetical protein
LEKNYVRLTWFQSDTKGSTTLEVLLDKTISTMSVSLTGTKAKLEVKDEKGTPIPKASITDSFSSNTVQILNFNTVSTKYTVEASADSDYIISVGGLSEVQFDFGFSQKRPSSIADTFFRPLAANKTILSIFVSDKSKIKNLKSAKIISAKSTADFAELEQNLKHGRKGFYYTEPFDAPTKMFRVKVKGQDLQDNDIDRLISTGIESTNGS